MQYSVALCIPTYERSDLVRDFLENCGRDYADAGIDIYYYDSSESDDTANVVQSWPEQEHLFYVRLPHTITLNEKMYRIFRGNDLKKPYDFISLSNDSTQHSREALQLLQEHMSLDYDFIDVGYQSALQTKAYSDPDEYLLECIESIQHIGSTFLNVRTMLTGVDWDSYAPVFLSRGGPGWSHMGADLYLYFRRFLALEHFSALHLHIERWMRRTSPLRKSSFYEKDMIRYACEGWVQTFDRLPDAYISKWDACRKSASKYIMTGVSDFFLYRRRGLFSLPVFFRYWAVWEKVTYVSRFALFYASLIPRSWLEKRYSERERKGLQKLKAFCGRFPRTVIYGAGNHGYAYNAYMELHQLDYEAFCESRKKPDKNQFAGHAVYSLAELEADLENIGFIIALQELNAKEVVPMLKQKIGDYHIFYEPLFEAEMRCQLGFEAFGTM